MTEVRMKHILIIDENLEKNFKIWSDEIKKEINRHRAISDKIKIETKIQYDANGNMRGYVVIGLK